MKIKITTNKTIIMDEILSCVKLDSLDGKEVDYSYSFEENPEYNYFEIETSNGKKVLAVNGKVELIDIPVQETTVETWDKKKK